MSSERGKSNLPINYEEQLKKEMEEMHRRVSAPSGDRIRTKGNQGFVTPDGREGEELHVVIVDFVSSNMFYDSTFDPNHPSPPACFAIGSEPTTLVPSDNSPVKQADSCSVCPNNQFGSAGRGKACKNTRLVAVMAAEGDPAEMPIWILSVSPTSLKEFDKYVLDLVGRHRVTPTGVKTIVRLDKTTQYASLKFQVEEPLTSERMIEYLHRREEAQTRLNAEPDVSQYQHVQQGNAAGRRSAIRR